MSVATLNPFALLDDEQDEAPRQVAPAPAKKQVVAEAKPVSTPATQSAKPASGESKPQRGRGAANGAPRGEGGRGRGGPRGPRPERSGNFEASPAGEEGQEGSRPNNRGGYRGGSEGQFGGRGVRGGRGRGRGGRGRDFDRHPANELKEGEKRQTIGRGNWGKEGEDTAELTPSKSADELDEKAKGSETPAEEAGTPAEEAEKVPAAPKEEEDNSKTLSQYMAERVRPAVELPPPRKAGEGSDQSKWKGTVALEKAEEVYYAKDTGKKVASKVSQGQKETSKKVAVEISFADEKPRYSDRPGRGRGGSSRGGRGGFRSDETTPNVNDTSAFPSLA